eukprot:GHVT01007819.1.p1 GENE.GHVT01007819.1~~GHVT01007819.1.p1  ORF type:complete len:247 (-),score=55.53 GHVT01007819.1:802-1542(-)
MSSPLVGSPLQAVQSPRLPSPVSTPPLPEQVWKWMRSLPPVRGAAGTPAPQTVDGGGAQDAATARGAAAAATAADFVPQMLRLSLDELKDRPGLLALEEETLSGRIEQLALDHYGDFIQTTRTVGRVRNQISSICGAVEAVDASLVPLDESVQALAEASNLCLANLANIRLMEQEKSSIIMLFELPSLLRRCIANACTNEAIDLLLFAQKVPTLYPRGPARGEPTLWPKLGAAPDAATSAGTAYAF